MSVRKKSEPWLHLVPFAQNNVFLPGCTQKLLDGMHEALPAQPGQP